ncbi:hypothetical protein EH223_01010 [candidate division KSB1 bacterium]|nr:hypothetical protein [candidate division KSB1 bacterium]RQW06976.1 MAG: hypothetical protein EH223_01010 [candidate division KSB1 bacterium]
MSDAAAIKSNNWQSSILFSLFVPLFYFAAIFCYIRWRLDPALIYQCQVPPFLWDDQFFTRFLEFPGGLVIYLSHLFSQFYYFPVSGALILTACLFFTFLLSRAIIKHFFPKLKNSLAAYLPSIFTLILLSQYEHPLSYTLAWLLSQLFFVLYLKIQCMSAFIRFLAFMLQVSVLYYAAAGFYLLFAAMAILTEILFKKSLLLGAVYSLFMLGIPQLAQSAFILTTKSAYFYLLLPIYDYRPFLTPYILYLYFPLLLVLAQSGLLDSINRFVFHRIQYRIAIVFLFLLTGLAALLSFDSTMYKVLKVDYLARQREWHKLLTFVEKRPSDDILVAYQTNRALYHLGRLSSDMFSFNQNWRVNGLFLPDEARKFFSIQVSDLYWDMAFLNESEHWAQEDHSNYSFGPRHLQRMATISILKGNTSLATMCLDALAKTILYRDWAYDHKKYIDYPELVDTNSYFVYLQDMQITKNFIITSGYPEHDMDMLLQINPENVAAFEYLMAYYLLTFRLGEFIAKLQSATCLKEPYFPRHYQEAILVYLHSTQWRERESLWDGIHVKTVAQFNDFTKILRRYNGDAYTAQDELKKKYGHTYWYYSLFNNPETRQKSS